MGQREYLLNNVEVHMLSYFVLNSYDKEQESMTKRSLALLFMMQRLF